MYRHFGLLQLGGSRLLASSGKRPGMPRTTPLTRFGPRWTNPIADQAKDFGFHSKSDGGC